MKNLKEPIKMKNNSIKEKKINTIIQGDCLEVLRTLPSESVDCIITSPPYWGLRDYGTAKWEGGDKNCDHKVGRATRGGLTQFQANNKGSFGDEAIRQGESCPHCGAVRIDSQLGLEKTPEEYVVKMVEVFKEIKRVLKKEGTCWLNLGDSYNGTGQVRYQKNSPKQINSEGISTAIAKNIIGLKPKDLIGIPWRVAFALQSDGWYLRQDIIWNKPNPMPESVTDRCTKAHEYIFLLAKSQKYYFDNEVIREPVKESNQGFIMARSRLKEGEMANDGSTWENKRRDYTEIKGANKRSVWTITTKPFKEAHFATFPEKLIEPMVKAGCPEKGIVLDPFMGSGTTGLVAKKLGRNYLGTKPRIY
jgi:DNA modification methylase